MTYEPGKSDAHPASETFATHPHHLLCRKAWVFHWHLFVTQVHPSCAVYSSCFVRTEAGAVSLMVVSCLLMFSGIGSLGKTSLAVEAS